MAAPSHVISSIEELETIYKDPAEPALVKETGYVTPEYGRMIAASPFVALATVGPEGLDCSQVTFINMDEFLGDDGDWIDPDHPLSFRGFMDRVFYDALPAEAQFSPAHRIFPDPKDPAALARLIDERGGVDVCFGGIGLNGHLAFNEPEAVTVEEFATRQSRALAIAPESRTDSLEVKEEVRKALRRYLSKTLDRRPVVLPFVMEM